MGREKAPDLARALAISSGLCQHCNDDNNNSKLYYNITRANTHDNDDDDDTFRLIIITIITIIIIHRPNPLYSLYHYRHHHQHQAQSTTITTKDMMVGLKTIAPTAAICRYCRNSCSTLTLSSSSSSSFLFCLSFFLSHQLPLSHLLIAATLTIKLQRTRVCTSFKVTADPTRRHLRTHLVPLSLSRSLSFTSANHYRRHPQRTSWGPAVQLISKHRSFPVIVKRKGSTWTKSNIRIIFQTPGWHQA